MGKMNQGCQLVPEVKALIQLQEKARLEKDRQWLLPPGKSRPERESS